MKALKYIWQLPQNLLGLILKALFATDKVQEGVWHWKLSGSISLGAYILLDRFADNRTLMHEQGHQKQSLYLGWLYLIVIGLPSIIWAGLWGYIPSIRRRYSYYSFYTELLADKLGNVTR